MFEVEAKCRDRVARRDPVCSAVTGESRVMRWGDWDSELVLLLVETDEIERARCDEDARERIWERRKEERGSMEWGGAEINS